MGQKEVVRGKQTGTKPLEIHSPCSVVLPNFVKLSSLNFPLLHTFLPSMFIMIYKQAKRIIRKKGLLHYTQSYQYNWQSNATHYDSCPFSFLFFHVNASDGAKRKKKRPVIH
jgi:hypothetical protein